METINHEYYVSPEVAELLKEAGFDWELDVNFVYADIDKEILFLSYNYVINYYIAPNIKPDGGLINRKNYKCCYLAPTLDVAQRWLREVKNISVDISSTCYSEWNYVIRKINQLDHKDNTILVLTACGFYTYEETKEAGIKRALELILEKGE